MSRPTRFQSPALESLAQQLRFAAPTSLGRQIDRIEELALELDPERNYPEDWLITRICGIRPEIDTPAIFVGRALVADLSTLAERLSDAAAFRELAERSASDPPPSGTLTLEQLCQRWCVSPKTVQRYRRLGLIARRIRASAGGTRHAFRIEHVEAFESRHRDRIAAARDFTRIDEPTRSLLVSRAIELQRERSRTLNQTAHLLATETGRALETIRQILIKHDAMRSSTGQPTLFARRGPPRQDERRLIERATFHGIEPEQLAERLSRSTSTVRRVALAARVQRLRAAGLVAAAVPVAESLADALVVEGLGLPAPTDLRELLDLASEMPSPSAGGEAVRLQAIAALRDRAARLIAVLTDDGPATDVDRVETDLRWVARLTAELVRGQLATIVRGIESAAGRPARELRAGQLGPLLAESLAAAGATIDEFDPTHGGRLAAAIGLTTSRVVARAVRAGKLDSASGNRRAAALVPAGVPMPDFTRTLMPRQLLAGHAWLEPPAGLRRAALEGRSVSPRSRQILARRYGFGVRPHTIAELAEWLRLPPVRAAVSLRDATREALAAHRP